MMIKVSQFVKAYLKVCRYEYFPGELIALFIPIFLTARSWGIFLELKVIEGILTFIILYLSGFLINAWTDREIDAKYKTFKSSIAWGVSYLGEGRLKALIMGHLLVSILLGVHISFLMGSAIPLIIILSGIFFGFGYSMRPLSFKTRGVFFHFVSLSLCCFFIPLVFLLYVVNGSLTIEYILFSSGFALVHYGLEVGNQILDYEEDLAENIMTPPVRIGLKRSLALALFSLLIGLPLMIGILSHWFQMSGLLASSSQTLRWMLNLVLITILLSSGYWITFRGLYRMYGETMKKEGLSIIMNRIRSHINYAQWQIFGVSGLFIVSLALFLVK
jgi:4-hydroxybenzoate polyprenyltransferase